jgi:hypothetical protein
MGFQLGDQIDHDHPDFRIFELVNAVSHLALVVSVALSSLHPPLPQSSYASATRSIKAEVDGITPLWDGDAFPRPSSLPLLSPFLPISSLGIQESLHAPHVLCGKEIDNGRGTVVIEQNTFCGVRPCLWRA